MRTTGIGYQQEEYQRLIHVVAFESMAPSRLNISTYIRIQLLIGSAVLACLLGISGTKPVFISVCLESTEKRGSCLGICSLNIDAFFYVR